MYIVTREGDKLRVNRVVIGLNKFLDVMMDGVDDENLEVSLSMVGTREMVRVIEFSNYYDRNPFMPIEKPIKYDKMERMVDDVWYLNFLGMERDEMFELMMVANYLENEVLLDLLCANVVSMIKGKSVDEMRELLLYGA